jgi:SAM-dependent methyltransferase
MALAESPGQSFDHVWDEIYLSGRHNNRYPWDAVVSYIYRYRPPNKATNQISIIEVGCGTASNLWFAAREGMQVAGIDASQPAIQLAQERFKSEDLSGDLRIGDFIDLPWGGASFDMAIDRGALTCCGYSAATKAIAEVARVLRPGGTFFCNVLSENHTSRNAGVPGPDSLTVNIAAGPLVGVGQICFYSMEQLLGQFPASVWSVLRCDHVLIEAKLDTNQHKQAEWRLIARKL